MKQNTDSQIFSACKGVFQGGGCKAVAYLGAYKEALAQGVIFSEVSGSSGGSLVAAMIAAGATPEDMEQIIKDFNVNQIRTSSAMYKVIYFFLNRIPKTVETILSSIFSNGNSRVKWKTWHFIVEGLHLSRYGYIYRTEAFEHFMDMILRKMLNQSTTVRFRDLKIPLTVVTSDIRTHNYKVFSTWNCPDMSVAHAVVASAAIPGYFKPVDGIYVDGCIVSNLPVFSVVKDSVYDRVLTFTTDSHSPRAVGDLDTLETVKQVAETIAQGGVDIQLASLPSCYNIRIPTEDYDILEFKILKDRKTREYVMQLGAEAMRRFLADKDNYVNNQFDNNIFAADTDPRMQLSYLSRGALQSVIVTGADTSWMDTQFPLIVRWINEGVSVEVFCTPASPSSSVPPSASCPVPGGSAAWSQSPAPGSLSPEHQRLATLQQLGCTLRFVEQLPVHGVFFTFADGQTNCLIARDTTSADFNGARLYSHSSDQFLISSAIEKLRHLPPAAPCSVPGGSAARSQSPAPGSSSCVPASLASQAPVPGASAPGSPLLLQPDSPSAEIASLTAPGAPYAGREMEIRTVPLGRLTFRSRLVSGYKYQNLHYLYQMYQDAHLAPFSSARLKAGDHYFSLLPPIVEESDGKLLLLDGAARTIYAHRKSIPTLDVLVLKAPAPSPASPSTPPSSPSPVPGGSAAWSQSPAPGSPSPEAAPPLYRVSDLILTSKDITKSF